MIDDHRDADTVIIYHGGCMDGTTAAWAANRKHEDARLIPASHGEDFPFTDVEDKHVVMVDFTFPEEQMETLLDLCETMEVYDHHISAERVLGDLDHENLETIVFDKERSGAGIIWDEYFGHENRPKIVDHVEDGDIWRHDMRKTREFLEHLDHYPMRVETIEFIHGLIENNDYERGRFAAVGEAIRKYKNGIVKWIADQAEEGTLDGEKVRYVECSKELSSLVGNELAEEPTEDSDGVVGIVYEYDDAEKVYSVSLRSIGDLDVSRIAEQHGGGGHKNAAAFKSLSLPIDSD